MTVSATALLLALLASLLVGIVAFCRSMVSLGVASTQAAFWQLHDDMIDAIDNRDLAVTDRTRELLSLVHFSARSAGELTIARFLWSVARGSSKTAPAGIDPDEAATGEPEELLLRFRGRFAYLTIRSLFRTSVMGWLLAPVAYLARQVLRRRAATTDDPSRLLAARATKVEIQIERAEAQFGRRAYRGPSIPMCTP